MKVYKRGNNGEILMHSDTYLGEDYTSPNLMHYKYLRKERRNGRWYYVYDDSEYRQAEKASDMAKQIMKRGYGGPDFHISKEYKGLIGTTTGHSWNTYGGRDKKTLQERIDKKVFDYAERFYKNHQKQKIKDIPKRIFSRAVSFVSKVLRFIRGD